jgi:vacuolar-type H+-ATPase subunit H
MGACVGTAHPDDVDVDAAATEADGLLSAAVAEEAADEAAEDALDSAEEMAEEALERADERADDADWTHVSTASFDVQNTDIEGAKTDAVNTANHY